MRIPCPHCGLRDYSEFRYGSDASKPRPPHGATGHGTGDLKAWHDFYFLFDNPKGPHQEYWQHVLGCRRWFVLNRNTATNEVLLNQKGDAS
jgi:heterotetrameric sarcosine oxidase delta subunit